MGDIFPTPTKAGDREMQTNRMMVLEISHQKFAFTIEDGAALLALLDKGRGVGYAAEAGAEYRLDPDRQIPHMKAELARVTDQPRARPRPQPELTAPVEEAI
jgi:hypothetical protein